jgi:hypothetical protein
VATNIGKGVEFSIDMKYGNQIITYACLDALTFCQFSYRAYSVSSLFDDNPR